MFSLLGAISGSSGVEGSRRINGKPVNRVKQVLSGSIIACSRPCKLTSQDAANIAILFIGGTSRGVKLEVLIG